MKHGASRRLLLGGGARWPRRRRSGRGRSRPRRSPAPATRSRPASWRALRSSPPGARRSPRRSDARSLGAGSPREARSSPSSPPRRRRSGGVSSWATRRPVGRAGALPRAPRSSPRRTSGVRAGRRRRTSHGAGIRRRLPRSRADSPPRSRHTVPTTCSSAQPPWPNETCPLRTLVGTRPAPSIVPRRSRPDCPRSPRSLIRAVACLEGACRSFGDVAALDAVDLELRRGEILALLGPNGAGKSTAVAVLLGLRRLDAGRAHLFGLDPREPAARRRVGAVLQEVGFPPGLRVREAVDLVPAHYPGRPRDAPCARPARPRPARRPRRGRALGRPAPSPRGHARPRRATAAPSSSTSRPPGWTPPRGDLLRDLAGSPTTAAPFS